jgi:hypothetical protein
LELEMCWPFRIFVRVLTVSEIFQNFSVKIVSFNKKIIVLMQTMSLCYVYN